MEKTELNEHAQKPRVVRWCGTRGNEHAGARLANPYRTADVKCNRGATSASRTVSGVSVARLGFSGQIGDSVCCLVNRELIMPQNHFCERT